MGVVQSQDYNKNNNSSNYNNEKTTAQNGNHIKNQSGDNFNNNIEENSDQESNSSNEKEIDSDENHDIVHKTPKNKKRFCSFIFASSSNIDKQENTKSSRDEAEEVEEVEEVDPNMQSLLRLYDLCINNCVEDLRYHLHTEREFDPIIFSLLHPIHNRTLLMVAANQGYVDIVNLLLRYKADPNQRIETNDNKVYTTALRETTAEDGRIAIVDCLLEARADADQWSLMSAIKHSNSAVIQRLVEGGANIEMCSQKSGDTPLILSAKLGDVDTVETLIGCNCNVNTKNKYGYTALMLASRSGHVGVINALIQGGADVELKNNLGLNALEIASLAYEQESIKAIQNAIKKKKNDELFNQKLTFLLGMFSGPTKKRKKGKTLVNDGSSTVYRFIVGEGYSKELLYTIFSYLDENDDP